MIAKTDRITDLITKHLYGELTPDEEARLQEWLSESEANRQFLAQLSDENIMEENMQVFAQSHIPEVWNKVQQKLNPGSGGAIVRQLPKTRRRVWIAAAVLLPLAIAAGYLIYTNLGNIKTPVQVTNKPATGSPPSSIPVNKAELLTVNGDKILLHDRANGIINTEGAFQVFKNNNDLYYKVVSALPAGKELYNKITTLNGSKYRIILPDNSTITLNVASSVKIGVSSLNSIRKMELTGEAEFSITPDSANRFMVKLPFSQKGSPIGAIEVIGTRFNVNAYDEEDDKTVTLLDGQLKVSNVSYSMTEPTMSSNLAREPMLMKPGDQASFQRDGNIVIRNNVDTAEVVGWRKGFENFERASTQKMLNILVRRYDVSLDTTHAITTDCYYTGQITPETDIETVLEIMRFQCDGLHLKYDPKLKRITVLP